MSVATVPKACTAEQLQQQFAADGDLRSLPLRHGEFASVQLPAAILSGQNLRGANFQSAQLGEAQLDSVVAIRTIFTGARLGHCSFRAADLRDTAFNAADLRNADLRGCSCSPDTSFKDAQVEGMRIDRRALRMLGPNRGDLTDADLATLQVEDDQAKLSLSFGGFWTFLHLSAVVIFLLPYCIYAISRYVQAQLRPCIEPDECMELRTAIGRYIVRGGAGDSDATDLLALGIFVLLLIYNVFRTSLVYKVRSLELSESATGLPQRFELRGYWYVAYYGCQLLLWLNLTLVLVHAYGFLDTPVRP